MPTLGDYYLQAGGDPGKLSGLFQYASSGKAAGKSMEQIMKDYMNPPTDADQAAYHEGEVAFNSAYMTGNAFNPNDSNAYAIQNWKTPTLTGNTRDLSSYNNFNFNKLPTGALQQGGNAVTPSFGDDRPKWLKDQEAARAAQRQSLQTMQERIQANNAAGKSKMFSSVDEMLKNSNMSEQSKRMFEANRAWSQKSVAEKAAAAGILPSNGSAYAGGYNQPEGYQPPGTTGLNPNVANPNANALNTPNNEQRQNTGVTPGYNSSTNTAVSNNVHANNSATNIANNNSAVNNTGGTNTTVANTQTPYLSRVSSQMAYSGAPRYNDIAGSTGQQTNGGLTEASKAPSLGTATRQRNTDFSRALWR